MRRCLQTCQMPAGLHSVWRIPSADCPATFTPSNDIIEIVAPKDGECGWWVGRLITGCEVGLWRPKGHNHLDAVAITSRCGGLILWASLRH